MAALSKPQEGDVRIRTVPVAVPRRISTRSRSAKSSDDGAAARDARAGRDDETRANDAKRKGKNITMSAKRLRKSRADANHRSPIVTEEISQPADTRRTAEVESPESPVKYMLDPESVPDGRQPRIGAAIGGSVELEAGSAGAVAIA